MLVNVNSNSGGQIGQQIKINDASSGGLTVTQINSPERSLQQGKHILEALISNEKMQHINLFGNADYQQVLMNEIMNSDL